MPRALVWFRRDLRLADNPALQAALDAGYAPIPVYIHAPEEDAPWQPGAASRVWLHRSLMALSESLAAIGSRLVLRSGPSLAALESLLDETQAEAVFWNRLYEPKAIARDRKVKERLKARGLTVESFNAALLVEPWTIATGDGNPYRVFTPFWKNASQRIDAIAPTSAPAQLPMVLPIVPDTVSMLTVDALGLIPKSPVPRWDAGFWNHWQPGEAGAAEMLDVFIDGAAHGYKEQRNFPDRTGSSKLSPHLHFGEISPRQIVQRLHEEKWSAKNEPDIAHYLSELGWREFSHHLLYHYPRTPQENLNPRFAGFPWADVDEEKLAAWQHGRTGVPIVDAGMRELWHTGWMHNRVRMIVASFLCKNLRYHWRHGARWFWDTLVDADLANNIQGWQWTAGTGADVAPYFRIFSPVAQAERFDAQGKYIQRWVPELAWLPAPALYAPWQHPELARQFAPDYPARPIIDLKDSREAALAAYSRSKSGT
jgi:deoxyribodipyrimidine photo-lyase